MATYYFQNTKNTLVIGAQEVKQTKPERAFRIYPQFFYRGGEGKRQGIYLKNVIHRLKPIY